MSNDMRRLLTLMETAMTMYPDGDHAVYDRSNDRRDDGGDLPPSGRRPRGERNEPKGGTYWIHNGVMVPITGSSNQITNLSGQVVIQNPEDFGLSDADVMAVLGRYDSTREEYQRYLDGHGGDLTRTASLWKSSSIMFEMMLKRGWLWVKYNPPADALFVVTPQAAKQQLAAAAVLLSLVQISRIRVTLAAHFTGLTDTHPTMSRNKTLTFGAQDYAGFMAAFGGVMHWVAGGELPVSAYFYTMGRLSQRDYVPLALQARSVNVKTPQGYRKRYAIALSIKPPASVPDGMTLFRISTSAGQGHDRTMTTPNAKGTVAIYDQRPPHFRPNEVEARIDGRWVAYDEARAMGDHW